MDKEKRKLTRELGDDILNSCDDFLKKNHFNDHEVTMYLATAVYTTTLFCLKFCTDKFNKKDKAFYIKTLKCHINTIFDKVLNDANKKKKSEDSDQLGLITNKSLEDSKILLEFSSILYKVYTDFLNKNKHYSMKFIMPIFGSAVSASIIDFINSCNVKFSGEEKNSYISSLKEIVNKDFDKFYKQKEKRNG